MAYILKKRIKGRTYYYLDETQRVKGKPRIVWQKYLGTADEIREKLLECAGDEKIGPQNGKNGKKLFTELYWKNLILEQVVLYNETKLNFQRYHLVKNLIHNSPF